MFYLYCATETKCSLHLSNPALNSDRNKAVNRNGANIKQILWLIISEMQSSDVFYLVSIRYVAYFLVNKIVAAHTRNYSFIHFMHNT